MDEKKTTNETNMCVSSFFLMGFLFLQYLAQCNDLTKMVQSHNLNLTVHQLNSVMILPDLLPIWSAWVHWSFLEKLQSYGFKGPCMLKHMRFA